MRLTAEHTMRLLGHSLFPASTFRRRAAAQAEPERSRWHLLFPLGGRERWRTWGPVLDEDGAVVTEGDRIVFDEIVEVVTYDEAWLRELVDNHERYIAFSSQHGCYPQPLPVSKQHAIEERIYAWYERPDVESLARAGGLHALHLHVGEDGPAPGLWGLIEWTPQALRDIEDGRWDFLSPTTLVDWELMGGEFRAEGNNLIAVGLVDQGFISTIGRARDGLPVDALGESQTEGDDRAPADAEDATDPAGRMLQRAARRFRALAPTARLPLPARTSPASVRRTLPMSRASEPAPTTDPAPSAGPDPESSMTDEEIKAIAESVAGTVSETLAEPLERVSGALERMNGYLERMEGMGDEEDAETRADDTMDEEDEAASRSTDGPVDAAAELRKHTQAAMRQAMATAAAEAQELLTKSRRLTLANFDKFVLARAEGRHQDADALLIDPGTSPAEYQGRATSSTEPAPSKGASRVTEATLADEADAEATENGRVNQRKALVIFKRKLAEYERAHGAPPPAN